MIDIDTGGGGNETVLPIAAHTSEISNSVTTSSSNSYIPAVAEAPLTPAQYRTDASSSGISRKTSTSDSVLLMQNDADDEENKYKRRSAIEWFSRWWRLVFSYILHH